MADRILFVDDEPAILLGYQRLLRNSFQVTTSVGGAVGLLRLKSEGPFAVVVADKRMPQMDGIEFLLQVKSNSPDTIRVMLTGESDLQTAVDAVNEGNIFRFLTKPCSQETLVKALHDSLQQYHLVRAEKELLGETLHGCISLLTEVINLVNPATFSQATRIRRYVRHVAARLSLEEPWKFEAAAMLSQLGCLALPPDIVETVYSGGKLSPQDEAQYRNHPALADELLKNIPRMELIAGMIAHQNRPLPMEWDRSNREIADMRLGAQILRAALAYDELVRQGLSKTEAGSHLAHKGVAANIIGALVELDIAEQVKAQPERQTSPSASMGSAEILAKTAERASSIPQRGAGGHDSRNNVFRVADLRLGMVLQQEIRSRAGLLIAASGQEISRPVLLRLKAFLEQGAIADKVTVCWWSV